MDRFIECWEGVVDPRTGNAALHNFYELLVIALCTVLCGGQSAVDMATFAQAKEPFLRSFLKLENGLPSHDTFSRLFRQLDPVQFGLAFQRFMARFSEKIQGVVAIDGKRGKTVGTQAPHTPNANDQIGDRNKSIGADAGQAGRNRALT